MWWPWFCLLLLIDSCVTEFVSEVPATLLILQQLPKSYRPQLFQRSIKLNDDYFQEEIYINVCHLLVHDHLSRSCIWGTLRSINSLLWKISFCLQILAWSQFAITVQNLFPTKEMLYFRFCEMLLCALNIRLYCLKKRL